MRAAQPAAEGQVLARLHVDVDVAYHRHLRADAPDELLGRDVALIVVLELDEQASHVLGRHDRLGAGEGDDVLHRRVAQEGRCHLGLPLHHGGVGDILTGLDGNVDEAVVLLGEQSLGNGEVQPAGENGKSGGRRQGQRLVVEHPVQAAVVAALRGIEGALASDRAGRAGGAWCGAGSGRT